MLPKQFVIYINWFAWSLDLNFQNAKQTYSEILYFLNYDYKRCDLWATILSKLVDSYLIGFKLHNNVASIQKNLDDKSLHVIIALGPVYTDTFWNRSVSISLRFQIDPLWIVHSIVLPFMIVFIVSVQAGVETACVLKWKRISVTGACTAP